LFARETNEIQRNVGSVSTREKANQGVQELGFRLHHACVFPYLAEGTKRQAKVVNADRRQKIEKQRGLKFGKGKRRPPEEERGKERLLCEAECK
jgi:hypothetical protein